MVVAPDQGDPLVTATTTAAARTDHARKVYGEGSTQVIALDDVSVDFASGEFTAIMGPSGSGKSTLMHCAAGLDDLTSGRVFIVDTDLTTPDDSWLQTVIDTIGLANRLDHRPSELSGGQQQRVAVGRALASRPEIIFADEPTGNLDSRAGAEILTFMRRAVRELGQTIVMVTHDPVSASYASRVIFLND